MSITRARSFSSVIVAAAATLALAACSSGSATGATGEQSSAAASGSTGGTIRLVTYDAYAISEATLADFTAKTGITVEVVRAGDGAEMVNRALLTKSNPEGDVLFGVDNNLLSRAVDGGLFEPYTAAGLDAVPAQYQLDPTKSATPIDVGDVCVNYDKDWFTAKGLPVPQTMADLADPKYKDLLVVENPATSTPGLAFMLATVDNSGKDGFADYWTGLRNNGVLVVNDWSTAYEKEFSGGSGAGPRPLVVSYASSPAAEVVFADPKPADGRSTNGVLESTCYRQVEFAGVLANAKNSAGAKKFVDYMLTEPYQADLPLNNFVFPVVPGTPLPKEFTDNATLVAKPFEVPPAEVAANRDQWVNTWTDAVQR